MYSRSYSDKREGMTIPDSYSGTALPLGIHNATDDEEPCTVKLAEDTEITEEAGAVPGFLSHLSLGGLTRFFPGIKLGIERFGVEEILIIATAAFLIFSGDGDVECAVMLLLLLFIN